MAVSATVADDFAETDEDVPVEICILVNDSLPDDWLVVTLGDPDNGDAGYSVIASVGSALPT